ncbi:hypothetical protein K1719_030331 [Acacia pycnantha]|nr:hypothetical protein K1719_030331 [Acacia pycnantha]
MLCGILASLLREASRCNHSLPLIGDCEKKNRWWKDSGPTALLRWSSKTLPRIRERFANNVISLAIFDST